MERELNTIISQEETPETETPETEGTPEEVSE